MTSDARPLRRVRGADQRFRLAPHNASRSRFALRVCWSLGALSALPAAAAAGEVTVRHIDDRIETGEWIGSPDGREIELRRGDTVERIAVNDLAEIRFQHAASEKPGRGSAGQGAGPGTVGSAPRTIRERPNHVDAGPHSGPDAVVFHLADGGRLYGQLVDPPQPMDAALSNTALGAAVALPYDRLSGIQLASAAAFPSAFEAFQRALKDRLPGQDRLITRDTENVKSLRGRLQDIGARQGSFTFGGQKRTFQAERIFGIVFAGTIPNRDRAGSAVRTTKPYRDRTSPRNPRSAIRDRVTLSLLDGSVLSGELRRADAESLRIATEIGPTVDFRLIDVASLRIASERVVFVSDVPPSDVRVEGLLHRPWPVRWDESVSGHRLRIDGRLFEKGIGVHSYTELTFQIGGRFEAFVATIGIDDAVRPRGCVVFRVLGDGKTLYDSGEVTGVDPPKPVRVDVSGAAMLTLVVDYGLALDLADHADWGGARLLKPARPPETQGQGTPTN